MLLRHLDELAQQGALLDEPDGIVEVSLLALARFEEGKRNHVAVWEERDVIEVPRCCLAYNDADDGSGRAIKSWQEFWHGQFELSDPERVPVFGGSNIMGRGTPNVAGILKAAIYLRYSDGFLTWLGAKDKGAADVIRAESSGFKCLIEKSETGKMYTAWCRKPKALADWTLPVVASLSDGRAVVLGLDAAADGGLLLDTEGVAVPESLELAGYLREPKSGGRAIVSGELHVGSGMGNNIFTEKGKPDELTDSEYTRLFGPPLVSPRARVLKLWNQRLRYPVKTFPNPDSSELVFFPEPGLPYEVLQKVVNYELDKRRMFFEALKARREAKKRKVQEASADDIPEVVAEVPNYLPGVHSATVFLVDFQGGQKRKCHVQDVFHAVNLAYWELLNTELLESNIQGSILAFCRAATTGHEQAMGKDYPSVYRLWTDVLTAALERRFVSVLPFWDMLPAYLGSFSTEELLGTKEGVYPKALNYLSLVRKLRRLQHVIGSSNAAVLDVDAIRSELRLVEKVELVKYGVLEPMDTRMPVTAREYIGPTYDLLFRGPKRSIDGFVRASWQAASGEGYDKYVRGAMVGILLKYLSWCLEKKRRFSPTGGRHPSMLRGDALISRFVDGVGLLENTKAKAFCTSMNGFVVGCREESRTCQFNNGFVMGLPYFVPPDKDETEEGDTEEDE